MSGAVKTIEDIATAPFKLVGSLLGGDGQPAPQQPQMVVQPPPQYAINREAIARHTEIAQSILNQPRGGASTTFAGNNAQADSSNTYSPVLGGTSMQGKATLGE